jgi:hypothetical protein
MTSARPNPRRPPSPAVFALAVLLAVPAAHAQGTVDPIPASLLRPYSNRESAPSTPPEQMPARFETVAPRPRDLSWLGGAVQYEAPR